MTKICSVAEKRANKKSKQTIDVNVIGVFKTPKEVLYKSWLESFFPNFKIFD